MALGAQQVPTGRRRTESDRPRALLSGGVRKLRSRKCARSEKRPIIRQHSSSRPSRAPAAPRTGFDPFKLRRELARAVSDAAFTTPRPIQAKAIPPALEGRDVLGLAQTGTGKTVAFALPILQRLLTKPAKGRGPRALVVAPTRELAAQVHAEFERLASHTKLSSTVVFGGVPIARQERALRRNPDVVVACPGRLLDLFERGAVRLRGVEVLVLDEADHMFDMGFLPDVRRILRALPERRQNLMFSATMSREIRKLADAVLCRPAVVELAHSQPAETIEHALYAVSEQQKLPALRHLLESRGFRSAIVFLRTKRRAKRLAERLGECGHAAVAMQGNMSQSKRELALRGFRSGRYDVLVATDIAARGLDIAGVSHVINFDVPNTPDAYTHRIGRTGRSEQTGKAFTFVSATDAAAVKAIEKRLGSRIERRVLRGIKLDREKTGRLGGTGGPGGRGRFGRAGRGRSSSAAPAANGSRSRGSGPRGPGQQRSGQQRSGRRRSGQRRRPGAAHAHSLARS